MGDDEAILPAALERPCVDIFETPSGYVIRADIAGAARDEMCLRWTAKNELVVAIGVRYRTPGRPVFEEFSHSHETLVVPIPRDGGIEQSRWGFQDGVLHVLVPRRLDRRSRRPIEHAPAVDNPVDSPVSGPENPYSSGERPFSDYAEMPDAVIETAGRYLVRLTPTPPPEGGVMTPPPPAHRRS